MPNIKDVGGEILSILTDGAKSLWDGPEDAEFLKTVTAEILKLRALKAAGQPGLETEIEILEEAVRQKAAQKSIRLNGLGEQILPKIVGIVGKMALALI